MSKNFVTPNSFLRSEANEPASIACCFTDNFCCLEASLNL